MTAALVGVSSSLSISGDALVGVFHFHEFISGSLTVFKHVRSDFLYSPLSPFVRDEVGVGTLAYD